MVNQWFSIKNGDLPIKNGDLTHSHKGLRQDIEWARDGDDGKLYIVQARPEAVASQKKVGVIEEYKMLEKGRDREPHTLGYIGIIEAW